MLFVGHPMFNICVGPNHVGPAASRRFGLLPRWMVFGPIAIGLILLAACGGSSSSDKVIRIGGIPDQRAAEVNRRFSLVADYLSDNLGVEVKYVPSVDYSAVVTAFKLGDIQLGWFGGLSGVQARLASPDSTAIAQRPKDEEFHSVFIVQADLDVDTLQELEGLTFTFGSELSTSGHLMPRHYLVEAGIDPEKDFRGRPSYSGTHDRTWLLVESGSFQAGALNEAVWETAVSEGKVDLTKVDAFFTTPPYYDYNWTIQGDLDSTFGAGFTDRVQSILLALDPDDPQQKEVLDLFSADGFIATNNENYSSIEEVARQLDIIR